MHVIVCTELELTRRLGCLHVAGTPNRYPYLLPNVVVAGIALTSLPPVLLFLEGPKLGKKSENLT